MNRPRYVKDVTDREIAEFMEPHLARLGTRVVVRRPEPRGQAKPRSERKKSDLDPDERDYLDSVFSDPNLTMTGRRDHLGLSAYRADRLKKALAGKGLVEEFSLNLGRETRGVVKMLAVTEAGCRALGKKPPFKRPQNVGPEHWWLQWNLAAYYQTQGIDAQVEMTRNGKRVDVGFRKDGEWVAVEIETTAKNAVHNVTADIEAGFDRVLVACRDAKIQKAVSDRLAQSVPAETLRAVKVIPVFELSFVKALFGPS